MAAEQRVWLITGCSSGFGKALAAHLLRGGQRVIVTARNADSLSEFTADYSELCRAVALDVTDPLQAKAAVAEAVSSFGRLDVVVNNAGYALIGAFEELSTEQIARNFSTNFFGALEVIRAALPILRAQRSGHIVNFSAAAAISNYPGFSIYGATKLALEGVSEALAAELKTLGIRVTIVQPGPFRTGFVERSLERAESHLDEYNGTSGKFLRILETTDGKQIGDPAKAAAAIVSAVESGAPPLRLVLGKYAHAKARQKLTERERELTAWEHVGAATDFSAAQ